MKKIFIALVSLATTACAAQAATTVNGGGLSLTEANQLETWLGVGDQTFSAVWTGVAGDAAATTLNFHTAVDGIGPTFSIYDIEFESGATARVGGYTALSWAGIADYHVDSSAFIFSLSSGERQFTQSTNASVIYADGDYFPTWGYGYDLHGGSTALTGRQGLNNFSDGYSYSYGFDQSLGQITIAGDTGGGSASSGVHFANWWTTGLDVYSLAPSVAAVPVPASLPLLFAGLGGLAFVRRRKRG